MTSEFQSFSSLGSTVMGLKVYGPFSFHGRSCQRFGMPSYTAHYLLEVLLDLADLFKAARRCTNLAVHGSPRTFLEPKLVCSGSCKSELKQRRNGKGNL